MMGSIKRNLPCQVVVPPKNVVVLIAIVIYSSMNLVPIFLNLVEGEHFGNETKKIIHSVQNFSSRLILNLSDGDDTVSADEIAFKEKWPHIKSKLCPDNVPSSRKYGRILFNLARQQLGLRNLRSSSNFNEFWTFWPDHSTAYVNATSLSSTGSSMTVAGSFIHVPLWKCANNNIRQNLMKYLPGAKDVSMQCSAKAECWVSLIGGMENVAHACIVSVVRDPISHFLSGYNEYEVRLNTKKTEQLRSNEGLVAHPLSFERFTFGEERRFEQFIVDLLTSPSDIFQYDLAHVYSMTGILNAIFDNYNRGLDGYLPLMNDLEYNYPAFLNETCPHVLPESAFIPWKKDERFYHASEADEMGFRSAAEAVWKRGGRESRALCIIHAIDYACFEKLQIEDFCKKIYSDDSFSKIIEV
mmetsp:Transcript_24452/g.50755  ORF Transcript_24452/g.50755 Transcript_24452/m.50755 type:complete len:413 (-) Transcript_24452:11-1249(-)